MAPASLSIVMPVLNEAEALPATLAALSALRARGAEIIVADGGSTDETVALARAGADTVVAAPRGRARQMNAGAEAARGDILLFLHADTRLPVEADRLVVAAIAAGHAWGRFDVRIVGQSPMLAVIGALMNLRSRLTGIATGDQAIFVTRAAFRKVGGFADIPLMEDIRLSRDLKRIGRPACLAAKVETSGRRWEAHGVWRTILLMWSLRFRYWRGADPADLARLYAAR